MKQTTHIKKEDAEFLQTFLKKGTHKAREITRAEILLLLHEGKNIPTIEGRVRCSLRTIKRVYGRYVEGGMERALYDKARPGQPKKTTTEDDAYLVAIACTKAPKGSDHWTLDFLSEQFEKKRGKKLGRTAIWLRLKTRSIKPWREKNVVHTEDNRRIH
jgi:transposase